MKIRIRYSSLFIVYLACFWVMPNYFAVKVSGLPLMTMHRVLLIALLLWVLLNRRMMSDFWRVINTLSLVEKAVFIGFAASTFVTGLFFGMNSFFNPLFDDILSFCIIYFSLYRYLDFDDVQSLARKILWVVCLLGLIEAASGVNVFDYLNTGMSDLNYGSLMRDTTLRVTSAYGHPLAYSMVLNLLFPLVCYDSRNREVYLFRDGPLFVLVLLNMLLTGSRSGIALFIIELLLILLLSDRRHMQKLVVNGLVAVSASTLVLMFGSSNVFIRSLIRSVLYTVDGMFHTNYAVLYGGDAHVAQSSEYRNVLWKLLGRQELLTPFGKGNDYRINIMIGGWYINSIDNFYINYYIRFGVVGVLALLCFFLVYVLIFLKRALEHREVRKLCLLFLIIMAVYLSNLVVVDEIGTLRIFMSVLALASVYVKLGIERETNDRYTY